MKVQKLQAALHAKAKESPTYRFYALYDKVFRADVLSVAYDDCRANKGASGVDDQAFADIEAYGLEQWLGELAQELKAHTYQPNAVQRVWIPKADGKQRPLGVPTIRDRVVQMAAVLVLEPIFETDLQPEQYAYRAPTASALDAIRHVHGLVNAGHTEVVDADLSSYFDEILHAELLKSSPHQRSAPWPIKDKPRRRSRRSTFAGGITGRRNKERGCACKGRPFPHYLRTSTCVVLSAAGRSWDTSGG